MTEEKVEKTENNSNPENNNAKPLKKEKKIRRFRLRSFLKGWFITGFIMMFLQNTIWPEISTQLEGFYKVSTLYISVLDGIYKHIFPYLNAAGEWIVDMVPKAINFVEGNWPYVIKIFFATLKLWKDIAVCGLILLGVLIVITFITYFVLCFIDKKKAQKWLEDAKEAFIGSFKDFGKQVGEIFKGSNKKAKKPTDTTPTEAKKG